MAKEAPDSLTIEQINEVREAFDIARAHRDVGRRPNYDTLEILLEIQIGTGARFRKPRSAPGRTSTSLATRPRC
jgi:hypothetical protein